MLQGEAGPQRTPFLGLSPTPDRIQVPHHLLSPTDQIADPLGVLELGPGCRHGCQSDKAGLDTAEQTDEGSEEQQGSSQN